MYNKYPDVWVSGRWCPIGGSSPTATSGEESKASSPASAAARRRRLSPPNPAAAGVNVAFPPPLPPLPPEPSATTSSGNDRSSSSASSPPRADITSENEQLRKDNQTLTMELARARRHCEELLGFLSRFLDVRQLDLRLLMQEDMRAAAGGVGGEQRVQEHAREEKCVKLFGVLLDDTHGAATRKRARCEEAAASERPIKMIRIGEPWVSVPSSGPARCGGDN
ncbi:hypothetical protein OsJ_29627 [Oryza sativa Japonica Group]|uniref:Uncharacterized protein n=1 Tax=Oryza sativa subsp. japonica TaxID=39947 RepID=B9G402_ORYSJ|nr:hypothetical protein OsJ_29627 [Oryza sativa Japonica Group]